MARPAEPARTRDLGNGQQIVLPGSPAVPASPAVPPFTSPPQVLIPASPAVPAQPAKLLYPKSSVDDLCAHPARQRLWTAGVFATLGIVGAAIGSRLLQPRIDPKTGPFSGSM